MRTKAKNKIKLLFIVPDSHFVVIINNGSLMYFLFLETAVEKSYCLKWILEFKFIIDSVKCSSNIILFFKGFLNNLKF
jgi:hypothetical protein